MNPAADQILQYVPCVWEPGDIVEWRGIASAPPKRVERGWCLAEELPDQCERLAALNRDGLSVYAGINPRREHGATTDAGVLLCRTLAVDFDHLANNEEVSYDNLACEKIEEAGLPLPTLRIFSGHGVHAYWKLTEAAEPDVWTQAQERLIVTLGSDRTIRNPERILRLPGFDNVKDPNHPIACFVIEADPTRVYDLATIMAHCRSAQPAETPAAAGPGSKGDGMELRGRAMLYAAKWPPAAEGERNSRAFFHACQIKNDFALSEADTIEILRYWNARNDPPLPDGELVGCVRSALKHAKFTPGAKRDRPPARRRNTAGKRQPAGAEGRSSNEEPAAREPAACEPMLTCMADVAPVAVEWLWPRRVPRRRITLVPGPPGEGKSIVTTYMAGRVSTGSPWPDGAECPRGSVILISAEDDPADTIRPRLDAHHADVRRIHLLTMVRRFSADGQPQECLFSLADVDALELALQAHPDCLLVVVDPIGSFVGGRTDTNRDNEVRSVLAPVAALAAKYGPAVVVVAHHRKGRGDRADDLVLGSKAFSGIARVVWHVTRDRENRARRLFLAGKNNLAPEGDGLAFTIGGDPPAICWERDAVRMNANDALAENGDDLAGATGEAVTWLRDLLADGRMRSTEIQHLAKKEGIALSTLKRAKRQAGVVAVRDGFGALSWWWWELPKGFKDAHT